MSLGTEAQRLIDSQPTGVWLMGGGVAAVVLFVYFKTRAKPTTASAKQATQTNGTQSTAPSPSSPATASAAAGYPASYSAGAGVYEPEYGSMAAQGLRGLGTMTGHGGPTRDHGNWGAAGDQFDFEPHAYGLDNSYRMMAVGGVPEGPSGYPLPSSYYLGPGSELLN